MNSILSNQFLPPNATGFEKSLCDVVSRISDVLIIFDRTENEEKEVNISDLWNPDRCPAKFLAWLAWSLAADVWSESLSEQNRRNLIKSSIKVHKQKGTIAAIKSAIAPLGATVHIKEWWEEEKDSGKYKPFWFYLDIYINENLNFKTTNISKSTGELGASKLIAIDDGFLSILVQTVDAVKPLRSRYEYRLGVGFRDDIQAASCLSFLPLVRFSFLLQHN